MNELQIKERNYTAKIMKEIHRAIVPRKKIIMYVPEDIDHNPTGFYLSSKLGLILIILGLLVTIFLMLSSCDEAYAYTDEQAIKTIIGEASNQGLIGMTAIGEVIRTRGSLRGFYGLNSAHVNKETKRTWKMARQAWEASKTSNLTHGADHFENVLTFGVPCWVYKCVETFRYRDHIFYREVA